MATRSRPSRPPHEELIVSEYKFFLLHKMLVLSINALVLGAVTVSMYFAAQNPEEFTLVFLKVFGGLLLAIMGLGFMGKRWLSRCVQTVGADPA